MRFFQAVRRVLSVRRSGLPLNVITSIAGVIIGAIVSDWFARHVISNTALLVLVIFVCMLILAISVNWLGGRVEWLFRRQRLEVQYLTGGNEEEARRLYQNCQELVGRAKEGGQILAVNSYVEVCSVDPASTEDRKAYLTAIESHFGKLRYHRLMQVPESELARLSLRDEVSADYRRHYRAMVEQRNAGSVDANATLLDVVPALYPTSFVVIENPGHQQGGYIIWQMNQHAPAAQHAERVKLTGVFLIDDPEDQLISIFKRWFAILEQSGLRRSIQLDELNDANSATSPSP